MQMNDNGQRELYEEQTNQIVEVGLKASIVNLPYIYLHMDFILTRNISFW